MTLPSLETSTTQINPLDLIEELVIANDWPFQRAADDEILVEISGRWTDYRLFFVWQEEASALQFCCRLDAKDPAKTPGRAAMFSTLILLVTYGIVIFAAQSFSGLARVQTDCSTWETRALAACRSFGTAAACA